MESASDKDEIIANFQAITDNYDVEAAKKCLEENSWNLEHAVNAFMARNSLSEEAPIPPEMQNFQDYRQEPAAAYAPPREDVYRQEQLIGGVQDYYQDQPERPREHPPVLDDLFFGAPVTSGIKSLSKGMGSMLKSAWKKVPDSVKGIPEGELFQKRLEKQAKGKPVPKVLTGKFKELTSNKAYRKKPIIFVLVDDKRNSNIFLSETLTNAGIIQALDERFFFFGSLLSSAEGRSVSQDLNTKKFPAVYAFYCKADQNMCEIMVEFEGQLLFEKFVEVLEQAETKFDEFLPNIEAQEEEEKKEQQAHDDEELAQRLQNEFYESSSSAPAASSQPRDPNSLLREQQRREYEETVRQDQERLKQLEEAQKIAEEQERKAQEAEELKEYNKAKQEEERAIKLSLLGEEPSKDAEGVTEIVFRKPIGQGRISRRFLASNNVSSLYDFIDTLDPEDLGFEDREEEEGIFQYELVTPPTPQIKVLTDKEQTLQEQGLVPRALLNIKLL